jgi:hypothetical protein
MWFITNQNISLRLKRRKLCYKTLFKFERYFFEFAMKEFEF